MYDKQSVLHDWTDEECVKILERCKHAINTRKGSKGKLIIVEMMISENENKGDEVFTQTKLCFDMTMLTMFNGKERSEKEWAQIFSDAGFKSYKISHTLGFRSVIEVFP